jgi:hypothetical protein
MFYLRFPWSKLLKVSLTVSLSYIFLEVLFGRKYSQTVLKLSQTFSAKLGEGIGNMGTKAHGRDSFLPLADTPGYPCAVKL